MTIGSKKDQADNRHPPDIEGEGQSAGIPAAGELEGNSYDPLGNPGIKHWQASFITQPGLDERNGVFFAAVEMTRMPMLVTDPNQPDNPIVFVNKAFLDMTGYDESDVLGRNCRFLQGEQSDPGTIAEIRDAVHERRAIAIDILNYKANGEPFWNALFLGPIFDAAGKLLYFFASQLDITRRRSSELAFRQAQKMEAIGQLTAGLAHDFNNLLQVITGNLEMATLHAGDNAALRQSIEHASQAAYKGGRITQQLLTFARKQRLESKCINLNRLLVECSDMLARTLGDKIDLRLDLQSGLPDCKLDPMHTEMALLNVLMNARDAMPDGGKVAISTSLLHDKEKAGAHSAPSPGGSLHVVLCVTDEGEGMPPEVLHRAIEPFFTTKAPGTGLGLAMVHGFVQQSHGKLEIESTPGKGTTVRLIFPQAAEHAPPQVPEPLPAANGNSPVQAHTILLVDDSDDVRQTAEDCLSSFGYRVLSARSGEEALELLDRNGNHADLLFTDVIMPGGMNGLMLADRVRQRLPDIPVLLTTGYMDELRMDDSGSRDRLPAASSMPMLNKPYRRTELADRVRAALNRNKPSSRNEE